LQVTADAQGFNFVYDMREWQRICTRVHLGDAALYLIQRDGTQPLATGHDWRRAAMVCALTLTWAPAAGVSFINATSER
jgi:hypothetical protein